VLTAASDDSIQVWASMAIVKNHDRRRRARKKIDVVR
jgi:hypothetical protein